MVLTYSSRLERDLPQSLEAAKPEELGTLEGLESLPAEILLDIYRQLDVESVFLLAQTNTLFHGLLRRNKAQILLSVLSKEFSPFEELLQLYTASEVDFQETGGTYQPRRVVYRRYPGDVTGLLLCQGGLAVPASQAKVDFSQVPLGGKVASSTSLPAPRTAALVERDLSALLQHCKTVRKWEELYPQLYWFEEPQDCRLLEAPEREKLRRAIYRWWLHARYFHGDHRRPRFGEPAPFIHDVRTSQMRIYSTGDLMELNGLLSCVKTLIRQYIYPNLEQNLDDQTRTPTPLEQVIECGIRERIVDTYSKLDPTELMFYFENLYSYPRDRLVTDVNRRHPTFNRDQESLRASIQAAIEERHWLAGLGPLDEFGRIVGTVRGNDQWYRQDGSHDGSIPAPGVVQRARGDGSPPGDDGRALTERVHFVPGRHPTVNFIW